MVRRELFLRSLVPWVAKGSDGSGREAGKERARERKNKTRRSRRHLKKEQDSHLPQLAGAAAPPDLAGLARVPRLEVAGALGGSALAVVGGAPVVAVEREFLFFRFARPREPARRLWSASIVYFEMGGKKKKKDNWRWLSTFYFDFSPSQGTEYDALYLHGASSAENSAHKPRKRPRGFDRASVSDAT